MNTKKLFIIALIFFILAGGTLIVYNFLIKDSGTSSEKNSGEETQTIKIIPISQERIFAPTIGEDEQSIKYYLVSNGNVFQSAFDGSGLKTISNASLSGLTKIIWSPDKEKVVSFFQKQGVVRKYFYDYQTKLSVSLNESIQGIAWSPDSQKIVYQYQSADGLSNNISIANPGGSSWRNILQTRLENLVVEWPSPAIISLRNEPIGLKQGSLFTVDPTSGNLSKILTDIYGLSIKWSPGAQKILYQTTDEKGKNLKLYAASSDGSQARELPVVTVAEKCTWSESGAAIFCAVPQTISEDAVWPDDYLQGNLSVIDDIYEINISTLQKTKIAQSGNGQSFDVQELILSPMEDYIFFINRKDGLLYSLKL